MLLDDIVKRLSEGRKTELKSVASLVDRKFYEIGQTHELFLNIVHEFGEELKSIRDGF